MSNTLTGKVSGRMSSRGWAIALGIGAVVLAAILLVVYLDRSGARHRKNVPTPVSSQRAHPDGNAGLDRRDERMYAANHASGQGRGGGSRCRSVVPGRPRGAAELPRPADHVDGLRGRDTLVDRRSRGRSARSRSRSTTCTVAVAATDRRSVDIYTSVSGVVKLFDPNVKVLTIPAVPGPSGGSNLVLRIETADASKWA